jgi:hypothetical protein
LPFGADIKHVMKHLCANEGLCTSHKEIQYLDPDNEFQAIGTGIYNITIRYKNDTKVQFDELTGKKVISNNKLFITRYGAPPICLFCDDHGHYKKDCHKFKMICKDCNRRGHLECTMATRINKKVQEEVEDDCDVGYQVKSTLVEIPQPSNTVTSEVSEIKQIRPKPNALKNTEKENKVSKTETKMITNQKKRTERSPNEKDEKVSKQRHVEKDNKVKKDDKVYEDLILSGSESSKDDDELTLSDDEVKAIENIENNLSNLN